MYSVEFAWSQPSSLLHGRTLFSGYQISVVPKAIPGFFTGLVDDLDTDNAGYVGSVSAVVDRDQHSFVVRQLRPSVRYIFQIQSVNKDQQLYGPPNSLEFMIESQDYSTLDIEQLDEQQLLQMKIKNQLKVPSADDDVAPAASSSSSMPNYLNNVSPKLNSFTSLVVKSVFFLLLNTLLIGFCLKT